jgi:hypothetical protein
MRHLAGLSGKRAGKLDLDPHNYLVSVELYSRIRLQLPTVILYFISITYIFNAWAHILSL